MHEHFYFSLIANDLFKSEIRPHGLLSFQMDINNIKEAYYNFRNELVAADGFLMCFVTSLREVAMENELYDPQYYDAVFIMFLKTLTNPNYNCFLDYMTNISLVVNSKWYLPDFNVFYSRHPSDVQRNLKEAIAMIFGDLASQPLNSIPNYVMFNIYTYHLKCANAFLRLLPYFVRAGDDTSKFTFTLPKAWQKEPGYAYPYEGYLREHFPNTLLRFVKICSEKSKVDKLSWWYAQVQCQKTITILDEQPKCSESTRKKLASFNSTDYHVCIVLSNGYDPSWPPTNLKRKHQLPSRTDFFQNMDFVDEQVWLLSEELLLSPLASKFHAANTSALMPSDKSDKHFMAVGPWFCQWMAAYGSEALKFLQRLSERKIKNLDTFVKDERKIQEFVQKWDSDLSRGVEIMKKIRNLKFAPNKEDFVKTTGEFLLEPCILIQLPWNFVLLYQWLALALIEVMKFELASMEIRHWPLSKGDVEMTARQLLHLIAKTKECVLRGLFWLCQKALQTVDDAKYPVAIMDTCILPTIPTLSMLCSGKAYEILHSIKSICFVKPKVIDVESQTLLPENAYLIPDIKLENFYIQSQWHLFYWFAKNYKTPLPDLNFELMELPKTVDAPPPRNSLCLCPGKFSLQEDYCLGAFFDEEWDKGLDASEVKSMLATQQTVVNELFKQHMFPKALRDSMISAYTSSEAKSKLLGMKYAYLPHLNNIQQAVVCGSLYLKLNSSMCGIGNHNKSLFAYLVQLSGECLEREQLVRAAFAYGTLIGVTPSLLLLQDVSSVSCLPPYLKLLKETASQQKNRNLSWLWKQLPTHWIKESPSIGPDEGPILNMEDLNEKDGDSSCSEIISTFGSAVKDVVMSFETRVGRMLMTIAKQSFVQWEKGNIAYPKWQHIQYLVPLHLVSLLVTESLPNTEDNWVRVQNLIDLLHAVILSYENDVQHWLKTSEKRANKSASTEGEPNSGVGAMLIPPDNVVCGRLEYERLMQLLHAFVGLGDMKTYEGTFGYLMFAESFLQFKSRKDQQNLLKAHPIETLGYKSWDSVGSVHLHFLLKVAIETWHPPVVGANLKNAVLSKVYFANTVLEVFELALQQQDVASSVVYMIKPSCKELLNVSPYLIYWRCELLAKVVQCEGLMESEDTEEQLANFAVEAEDILYKLWGLLKDVRLTRKIKLEIPIPDYIIANNKKLEKAISAYYSGKVTVVTEMLHLCCSAQRRKEPLQKMFEKCLLRLQQKRNEVRTRVKPKAKKTDKNIAQASKINLRAKNKAEKIKCPRNVCRWCKKVEDGANCFIICEECKKKTYPDINYYCSTKCRDAWWEEEHMAEHLEFDLGLKTFD